MPPALRWTAPWGSARIACSLSLGTLLVALWALTHRYAGLDRDARVYAIQALSRLRPNLATDLYLQNTSQDQYTLFSPFYAFFIDKLGLENSAILLTGIFIAWFMSAAWAIAERTSGYKLAWLSAAFLVATPGYYGAFHVFQFPEPYLTARLPAYALVVSAIALHLWGRRWMAFAAAAFALAVHPIMALPGVLLLCCLNVTPRMGLMFAAAGVLTALAIAAAAAFLPVHTSLFTLMDPLWLEVVHERSQFLFLQLWSLQDWDLNIRPFLSLTLTIMVLPEGTARKLALAALTVGVAGMAIAWIAGTVGPVAILVQGQAWRWEWITILATILLIPSTLVRTWESPQCGPICSLGLILAWTFPAVDGTLCIGMTLILWSVRSRITARAVQWLRMAATVIAVGVLGWVLATIGMSLVLPTNGYHGLNAFLLVLRTISMLDLVPLLVFGAAWCWVFRGRSSLGPYILPTISVTLAVLATWSSLQQRPRLDSAQYLSEFADWRTLIPENSTVFVTPAQDTGTLVWFALQRPNYLTVDQSAGVIFSRATALEVKRRSAVLLPVEEPSWRLQTRIAVKHAHPNAKLELYHHLTAQSLYSICSDPQLGFVMSNTPLGIQPLARRSAGKWRDWNLYDCRKIRSPDA